MIKAAEAREKALRAKELDFPKIISEINGDIEASAELGRFGVIVTLSQSLENHVVDIREYLLENEYGIKVRYGEKVIYLEISW